MKTVRKVIIPSLVLFVLIVISNKGFNVIGWKYIFTRTYTIILSLFLLCFILYNYQKKAQLHNINKNYVTFLFVWPFMSALFSSFFFGHLLDELLLCLGWNYAALFYYYYSIYSFSEKQIVSIITIVGILGFFIQVFEQLFPEMALFGVIDPDSDQYYGDIAGMRNDLYRLNVGSYMIPLFLIFYY